MSVAQLQKVPSAVNSIDLGQKSLDFMIIRYIDSYLDFSQIFSQNGPGMEAGSDRTEAESPVLSLSKEAPKTLSRVSSNV